MLLRRAGFIVGEKSETTPTECISFIGKQIDTKAGTVGNATGALPGAFRSWVRGVVRGKCNPVSYLCSGGKAGARRTPNEVFFFWTPLTPVRTWVPQFFGAGGSGRGVSVLGTRVHTQDSSVAKAQEESHSCSTQSKM